MSSFEQLHPRNPQGKFVEKNMPSSSGVELENKTDEEYGETVWNTQGYRRIYCDGEAKRESMSFGVLASQTMPGVQKSDLAVLGKEFEEYPYPCTQPLEKLREIPIINGFKTPAYYREHPKELEQPENFYSNVAIAKKIRKLFKEAKNAGAFPKDLKISVRSSRYSIDVSLSMPENFDKNSAAGDDIQERARDILGIYNTSNSDPMTDYFDETYYYVAQWE